MLTASITGHIRARPGFTATRVPPAPLNVSTKAFDPSQIGALEQLARHAGGHLITLADVTDAAGAAAQAAAPVVKAAGGGPFDFLAKAFESALEILDRGLVSLHVPNSYGFAIILLTILVKLGTYPLTKKQVESTVAMQAIQPRVKEMQARYPNDPERLQMETARLYKDAGVNPLAGCLPTLATIPVFIGLYRALTLAAQDGLLNDSFFWIPSLGGPTTVDQQLAGTGLSWLWPFVDGQPPLGWTDTIAYLILPILLVVSQSVSQKIISPPSDDPAQQQTQAILKYIPLLIGWFSLNVPSGLTLYWFTNNILTTAQQVYLKGQAKATAAIPSGGSLGQDRTSALSSPQSVGAESSVRKSKGEKFRARQIQQASGAVQVVADARGKKRKGEKFKTRKQQESGELVVAESTLSADKDVDHAATETAGQSKKAGSATADSVDSNGASR